jgi:hypothetical protein
MEPHFRLFVGIQVSEREFKQSTEQAHNTAFIRGVLLQIRIDAKSFLQARTSLFAGFRLPQFL